MIEISERRKLKTFSLLQGCEMVDSCWYEERWYDSDLENALLYHEVPVTEKTMKLMREKCKHIFDDKSARNEMLEDKAFEIKEAIQKAKED